MAIPTDSEMAVAVTAAEEMRARGEDADGVARCLLYMRRRLNHLERVTALAERYVHFGLAEHDHAALVRAITEAKDALEAEAGDQDEELGLG